MNTELNTDFWVPTIVKQFEEDTWLPEMRGGGRGNWMKAVKRYKLPVVR